MVELNNNIIKCTNISKQFGFFFALKKISFEVRENTIYGIVGANGAGKTTLIKILCGLLRPTFGQLLIKGMSYEKHSNNIKEIIGTLIDTSFLYEELTLFENLKFYANIYFNFENDIIKAKIEQFTDIFNLKDWVYEPIRNLSKGMKQKVEIMRILMHNPSILILDEPFTGLDFKSTELLIDLFKELKEKNNITMVITTHKIDVALQICDDLMILKRGKINKYVSKEDYNKIKIKSYF